MRALPRFEPPAVAVPQLSGVELASYDVVVVSTSGGKDSQSMLWAMVQLADRQGFDRSRIVAVHADLGRVEWDGTKELAQEQAEGLGLRFEVVRKGGADLLDRVAEVYAKRPATPSWPSPTTRWCTSDFKRGPIQSVFTSETRRLRPTGALHVECPECWAAPGEPCEGERGPIKSFHRERREASKERPRVRILNCMGLRAAESAARSKLTVFQHDKRASNSKRHVDIWLPIHAWSVDEVWAAVRASGLPSHRAYALGMPRLSCAFCIFATRPALLLAGEHNPRLLSEYVALERQTGYTFKRDQSLEEIQTALANGERQRGQVRTWEDCGA